VFRRERLVWSVAAAAFILTVSFAPMVAVYEHWLVPDSLSIGLGLIALALAGRPQAVRWYAPVLVGLCVAITLTKEVGFGVVLLVAAVVMIRSSWRLAGVLVITSALLFATTVLPASSREGTVLWNQPPDTELTMERFRVIAAGLIWSELSPELAEVGDRSAECGMSFDRLVAETFRPTDRIVAFADCDELWEVVDGLSQIDVLRAHASNPMFVTSAIERGFAPDLYAMAVWGSSPYGQDRLTDLDRGLAGVVSLLPMLALVVALLRRRGRLLAGIAVLGSAMALCAALVDPTSQDRHTLVFRMIAFGIAMLALTDATAPVERDEDVGSGATPTPSVHPSPHELDPVRSEAGAALVDSAPPHGA
jgi:hypothetical protein